MKHMYRVWLLIAVSWYPALQSYKIGLCIVATGKYDRYAQKLIESARNFFCKGHDITYFVFTDGKIKRASDVVQIYQQRLGWPHDTLMRFEMYAVHKDKFSEMDYLFASDSDMLFVAPVDEVILGDRVATQHPGFVGRRGTYERNLLSKAAVTIREGKYYFAGGFYGGTREEFLKLVEHLAHQVRVDLEKKFIAVWHDESHLNRYFIDNKPTRILSPAYCYPESWNLPYAKKLLALDKNHDALRK